MPGVSSSACVLDTSVYIDLEYVDLGRYSEATALLTAITIGELAYGLGMGDTAQQAVRTKVFQEALVDYEILPFDIEQAKFYGALATLMRAAGRTPRPRRLDLQIAATAGAARLPLLTCNPDDFTGLAALVDVVPVSRTQDAG
jgi:predicted nucleic acid-binding protein